MDTFDRCRYDIVVRFPRPNRNNRSLLQQLDDVESVLENQEGPVIFLEGLDEPLYHIQGIIPDEFEQFHTLSAPEGQEERIRQLDDGRNILLTTILRDKWNLRVGDSLNLILSGNRGNKFRRTYTIIGFFDNFFPGLWSYGLISERNFKRDIAAESAAPFYVRSGGDTRNAVRTIQTAFARQKPIVQTVEAMKQEILSENSRVFMILRFFSAITAAAGTFGILNNMIISFMERKRTLAVLRSLGMTRLKVIKMLLIEGLAAGLLGGAAGVGTGFLLLSNTVPYVIKAIGSETRIIYSVPVMLYCFLGAVTISVLASIGPMLRAGKMNLISTIQYE
jgi:putative ABC transport system permease protein